MNTCLSRRRPVWVLVWLSLAAILQGLIVNGLVNVVISPLEKRFTLPSSTTGWIPSSYDIAAVVATFPVSYYGGKEGVPAGPLRTRE